jgi:hypothetical protein
MRDVTLSGCIVYSYWFKEIAFTLNIKVSKCLIFMTRTAICICHICQKLKVKFVSYLPVKGVADITV